MAIKFYCGTRYHKDDMYEHLIGGVYMERYEKRKERIMAKRKARLEMSAMRKVMSEVKQSTKGKFKI